MVTVLLILTAFTVGVDTRQDIPVVVHDTKTIGHWSYNHILKPTGHAIDKAYHAQQTPPRSIELDTLPGGRVAIAVLPLKRQQ